MFKKENPCACAYVYIRTQSASMTRFLSIRDDALRFAGRDEDASSSGTESKTNPMSCRGIGEKQSCTEKEKKREKKRRESEGGAQDRLLFGIYLRTRQSHLHI